MKRCIRVMCTCHSCAQVPRCLMGDAPSHNNKVTKRYEFSSGIIKIFISFEQHVEGVFWVNGRLMSRCGKDPGDIAPAPASALY